MRKCKGSFTIEASYILPLILVCFFVVINLGVSLHEEVCTLVENQMERKSFDMVKAMYRREYVKELFGDFYED